MKRNQLDELPERWTTVTLEDVATICYGRALPSNKRLNDGGVPVYGSSGIVGEHHEALHEKASLIIGRKGSVGTVYLETRPFWCIDTAFYLDKVSKWVDLAFLAHALHAVDLRRLILVVGVPGINRNDLGAVKFPLPPLSEQQEIVEMLREADTLRQLRQQASARIYSFSQALLYESFGDPLLNPKQWPKVQAKDVSVKITDGTHQPPKFDDKGEVPFLFVSNIVNGVLDIKTERFISEKTYEELTQSTPIERNDILYSTVGSYGVAVIVDTDERFAFQRHIAHIKPDLEKVNPLFLKEMLNSSYVKAQADRAARGVAQKTVNLAEIRRYDIYLPPLDLQNEFAASIEELSGIIGSQQQSHEQIEYLISSVTSSAFVGTLTVGFRDKMKELLVAEAAERDIALGIARQRHSTLDLTEDDQRDRLTRSIARQLPATLAELRDIAADETSITQQSFLALTQMVEEIAPALPDKEERLFNLIDALLQNVQHGLRQEFVASAEVLMQRILPFYQQDIDTKAVLEMLLKSAKKIDAVTPHAPQAARSIRTHITQTNRIDERLEKLLAAIEQRPPYFRAFDLVHDGIGLAEATGGLHILESLGFVRRVMWEADLDAVFRLVDPAKSEDAIHINGEAR